MSSGNQFLRSAIELGDIALVRRATDSLFTEEEVAAFRFVRQHLDTYGTLPTIDVCRTEGYALPQLRQNAGARYYYDGLRKRFAYTEVNTRHPRLVEAMRAMDVASMLNVLREMVHASAGAVEADRYSTVDAEMDGVLADYRIAKANPGLRGITTGWPTLDVATNGLMGGDLIVLVGRPSMGKSWELQEMAYAANLAGHAGTFTSMEMMLRQIARRWLGRATGINPNFIRSGELGSFAEELMYAKALAQQDKAPMHLLAGDMRKSVSGIEGMILECNPEIVYVDAAYLLTPSGRKNGYISKWESISEVVRELKELAIRYDIPVVITVQFNRNQKSNSTKELDMGDIAGSDSIPQDASIVLGIRKGPAPFQDSQRIIEVMKNRDGETPRFATAFTFTPVSMREVPLIEQGDQQQVVDDAGNTTGWMV